MRMMTRSQFEVAWSSWRSRVDGDTLYGFRIVHGDRLPPPPVPPAGEYTRERVWMELQLLFAAMNSGATPHEQALAEHWARGFHHALRVPWDGGSPGRFDPLIPQHQPAAPGERRT